MAGNNRNKFSCRGICQAGNIVFQSVLFGLALILLGGCGGKNIQNEIEYEAATFSFDEGTYPTELGLFEEYLLAPGDMLDVLFQFSAWQQKSEFRLAVDNTISIKFVHIPELNETQLIQPNGRVSLPYIGEVYVVGKTVSELAADLKQAYSKELVNPELYVTVDEFQAGIKELKKDLHTAPRGLSRLVTVRPDGYATFPLAGDVFVAKKTLPQVNLELDQRYNEKLPGLHVDLFLEKHSASVIYVAGQVHKAGTYTITRPTTAFEAIAMAEGQLSSAALDKAFVVRRADRKLVARRINLKNLTELNADGSFFYLKPDDILYLPERNLSKMASVMQEIQQIIMFRGWSISLDGPLFNDPLIK